MPNIPNYSETDTRAKLINPTLHVRNWPAVTHSTSRHP